jgi:hypothetical protein
VSPLLQRYAACVPAVRGRSAFDHFEVGASLQGGVA